MQRNKIIEIIAAALLVLFVYAAVSKLIEVDTFESQLGQSPMLTDFAVLLSWGVPVSELIIALLLVFPFSQRIGFYASFTLLVVFTAYIVVTLLYSSHVPCSCGGIIETLSWTEHLILNGAFIVLSALGILFDERTITAPYPIAYEKE